MVSPELMAEDVVKLVKREHKVSQEDCLSPRVADQHSEN